MTEQGLFYILPKWSHLIVCGQWFTQNLLYIYELYWELSECVCVFFKNNISSALVFFSVEKIKPH